MINKKIGCAFLKFSNLHCLRYLRGGTGITLQKVLECTDLKPPQKPLLFGFQRGVK